MEASGWNNLGWWLREDFPLSLFACLEAKDPISLMFTFGEMFTVLKGSEIFSSPDIPARYSSFLGSLTCFGVMVRYSVLKSYWVTSDITSAVRTLEAKSSAPSSVSLA